MDASEYLAFVPLLIYGISLADLLSEWKRLFEPQQRYFPYTVMTIIMTEGVIYNIFIYQRLLDELANATYLIYLTYLIPPLLFMMVTQAFTPEKDNDTKTYYEKQRKTVFLLYAAFVASHFLHPFDEPAQVNIFRIVIIAFMVIVAFTKDERWIYLIIVFWIIAFSTRIAAGLQGEDQSTNVENSKPKTGSLFNPEDWVSQYPKNHDKANSKILFS